MLISLFLAAATFACDRPAAPSHPKTMIEAELVVGEVAEIKDPTLVYGGYFCWKGKLENVVFKPENRNGDLMQKEKAVFKNGDELQVMIDCQPGDAPPGPCQGPVKKCSAAKAAKRVKLWLWNLRDASRKCVQPLDLEAR